jgi:hypothetical protein
MFYFGFPFFFAIMHVILFIGIGKKLGIIYENEKWWMCFVDRYRIGRKLVDKLPSEKEVSDSSCPVNVSYSENKDLNDQTEEK